MYGGFSKEIPKYKLKADDIIKQSNEQKTTDNVRKGEKQKYEPTPLLNLQLYPQQKPKQEQPQVNPMMYIQPSIPMPVTPFYDPYQQMQQQTVIKNYNINTTGPVEDHTKISVIYEDVLPTTNFSGNLETLSERILLYDFIRSTIFNNTNGTNTGLSGGSNTLLSYLKFDELNPFNSYRFSNNPYKGLPSNYLIYRSCYPIRKDRTNHNNIQCAKDGTTINIRIYKLTEDSYENHDCTKYDAWREHDYYRYITNEIVLKKVCPNLICMYGYFLCENSRIDFEKIEKLKYGINKAKDKKFVFYDETTQTYQNTPILNIKKEKQVMIKNPHMYTGKVLVILTESPTYTLFQWASKKYMVDGVSRVMINRSVYKEEIWMSILFQLLAGLYVLQINEIHIENFSIKNNVFIKDMPNTTTTKYWKYIINNIEYYVPNYGYLVMIDTDFREIKPPVTKPPKLKTLKPKKAITYKNNIVKHGLAQILPDDFFGTEYVTTGINNNKNIMVSTTESEKPLEEEKPEKKITGDPNDTNGKFHIDKSDNPNKQQMFLNAMSPDSFKGDFIKDGGSKPNDNFLNIIEAIHKDYKKYSNKKIKEYIFEHLSSKYLHNKIGTTLKENEISNIRATYDNFKAGQIVVLEEGPNSYKFVLIVEDKNDGYFLVTYRDKRLETKPKTSLKYYVDYETLTQTIHTNQPVYNEENLLDTFIISE
jgi:hypothetical protein